MRKRTFIIDINKFTQNIVDALDDGKAMDIQVIDVSAVTTITDRMIIASGRSNRQVKSLAEKVVASAKEQGVKPLGVEGGTGEWVLVDLGDVIAHLMHPTTRAYYQLEKLWSEEHQQTNASS
ncbi:MAG: ribosome-associated protein [Gammaproteobacteria bacterium]